MAHGTDVDKLRMVSLDYIFKFNCGRHDVSNIDFKSFVVPVAWKIVREMGELKFY